MHWLMAGLAAVLVLLPQVSAACPVCFGPQEDDVRLAFILTTAFMTVLPLAMLGCAIWWYVRQLLEREREYEASRQLARDASGESAPSSDGVQGASPSLARV
jgi:hypothetical protein